MSFTGQGGAGQTISQTAATTDTNPGGMSALTGVTTKVSGIVTIIDVGGADVSISGTLTVDPRTYMIVNARNITNNGGGTLNAGVQFASAYGGGTLYSRGIAFSFSGTFSNNGTFNQLGAMMESVGSSNGIQHQFNGTVFMRSALWLANPAQNNRLRMNTATMDIDGLVTHGLQFDALMTPTASTILKNISPENNAVGIENALAGGAGTSQPQTFDGVPSSLGKVQAVTSNWQGRNDVKLIACEAGTSELIMPDSCGNTGTSGHGGRIYHRYAVTAQTTVGAAISGAVVYLKDTNNGKRKAKTISGGVNIDQTADQVQINSTSAGGTIPTQLLLTSHVYRDNSVGDLIGPDGNEIRDLRGKVNTPGSDLFDIYLLAYQYQITPVLDVPMKGLTTTSVSSKMLADSYVTKTQAVAAALTSVATLDDLYDAAKNWKVQATQANLEYPTIGALLATPDGTILNLGNRNLAIDATAASAFAVNSATNTITIKSSTLATGVKLKSLVTTGTVTYLNGAGITVPVQDSTGIRINIVERTGKLLSTYVTINGTPVGGTVVDGSLRAGWVPLSASRTITVQPTDQIRIAASSYGYKPAVFNILGSEVEKFTLSLEVEPAGDKGITEALRQEIADCFASVQNGQTIEVTINKTMAGYTPDQVISGFAYYIVSEGYLVAGAIVQSNNANLYTITDGTITSYSPAYKLRMADLDANGVAITPSAVGYSIPLVVYYQNPSTGEKSGMTLLNASGAFLATAPWPQSQASIGDADQQAIAVKTKTEIEASTIVAKEATVASKASQTSVTNLGSPMQASAYVAPDNTGIASIKAKTDTLVNAPTLVQIEASTVLAKESTGAAIKAKTDLIPASPAAVGSAMTLTPAYDAAKTAASAAAVLAIPTNPLLTTDARLNTLDANISTRSTLAAGAAMTLTPAYDAAKNALPASSYTAPDNASISAIKAKTDTLVNAPTVAQIEASTVLAKEASVTSRASQASITALGSPLQAANYTAPDNTSIAAIKTKTDSLVNGPSLVQIEGSAVLAKESTVASRLAASAYTAPDNASIASIKAKTDTLVNTDVSGLATTAQAVAIKAAVDLSVALSA